MTDRIAITNDLPGKTYAVTSRVKTVAGVLITQADVSSIDYEIWNLSSKAVIDSGTISVAAAVFDTLQTPSAFASGYNFQWDVAAALIPPDGATYRGQVTINFADGSVFPIVWDRKSLTVGKP